jgi:hypothetical protein
MAIAINSQDTKHHLGRQEFYYAYIKLLHLVTKLALCHDSNLGRGVLAPQFLTSALFEGQQTARCLIRFPFGKAFPAVRCIDGWFGTTVQKRE